MATTSQRLGLPALTALVVGSMVGAGIFSLPQNVARSAGPAALIGWAVSGAGMLMLAFVFQALANRRPDLDTGIYAYAREGFGNYIGFSAAWGYWSPRCLQCQLLRADLQRPRPFPASVRRRHACRRGGVVSAAVDRAPAGAAWPAYGGHCQWPGDGGRCCRSRCS